MSYTKQQWVDGAAGGTPVDAARLTWMESGIQDASNRLDTLTATALTTTIGDARYDPNGAAASRYLKPSTGIPATDLAGAVQSSLALASTALQSAPVSSVNGQTGAVVLGASDVGALTQAAGDGRYDLAGAAAAEQARALAAEALLVPKGATSFNVRDYGAKGDGRRIRNVTATATSPVVTFNAANFSAADVGKVFVVYSDTAAGAVTTIQSVQSATSITLAANAGLAVSGTAGYALYGSDDSAAFAAAFTAAQNSVSVDTTVGPNQPQGLGQVAVTVPATATGSLFVLANQITVPSSIRLECQSMIANLLTDRFAPCIVFSPYSAVESLYVECMFGTGIQLGSAAGVQADVHARRIVLWHVGKSVETTGLLRSQDGVALLGYGFLIDLAWMKGGARGIFHNAGSDCAINRAFVIGAHTGVYMQQSNQVAYGRVILDSNGEVGGGYSGVVLDNACSDISFDVQAFIITGSTRKLDNVVLVGNGSTNKNVFLRMRVAAQMTGGNVVNFAQAQDVECDVLASNTASNSSGGSAITTVIVFGTVGGTFRCHAEMNGTITPYTGTPGGTYRYARSGVEYMTQAGAAGAGAAQTANGTGAPAPAVTGNDQRGKVSFGSGTGPAAGNQVVVTFAVGNGWVTGAPYVQLTPLNAATAACQPYVAACTASTLTIGFGVAPAAGQAAGAFQLTYRIEG